MQKNTQPDALLGWMDSLADPTRLRLLRLLEHHELSVIDLCDVLQLPQSTVSRHLKILADQRWLHSRREATTHLYRMILDELEPAARRLWLLAREQTDAWPTTAQDDLRLARRLRQRQEESDAFFAGAAADWEKLRADLYGTRFTLPALLALLPRTLTVADLGCGTGDVAVLLAPHVRQVIGVDNSPAMLKAARKRAGELANVDLRRGDLANLPLDSGSCDAATCILALTYVPDPAAALKEAARVLRPGGRLVLVDLLPHDRDDFRRQLGQQHPGFPPDALASTLRGSHFADVAISPLPPDPNTKGPALFLATATRA